MQGDLALQLENKQWATVLLSGLLGVMPECDETLHRMIASFDENYARVSELHDLLVGFDTTAYGERAAAVFTRWDKEDGGGPTLPAMQAYAIEYFGLPVDGAEAKAAMLAAVLGEIPNTLQYHGNEHYRKVMFHTIRLLATQIEGNFPYQPLLYKDDMMKLLTAAAIHDLSHEGGDNLRDGIYAPGYMEQRSFDQARPGFDAINLDPDYCKDIEALIFCTDITFVAGDNSPCVRMKKIYKHFFLGGLPEGESVENMLLGKMRRFEDNPRLSIMAMLLHEADIATSAGLTYDQSKIETINIMGECGLDIAGPDVLLKFLNEQLGGTMITPAAQKIFAGSMEDIIQQANHDLQSGIDRF